MSDDFLWDCAFVSESKASSTKYLVPGYDDDEFQASLSNELYCNVLLEIHDGLPIFQSIKETGGLSVNVDEIRGQGVFDLIGGEVWEASLLLCSFILLNPSKFANRSVLEVGGGLGLPSFLLADFHLLLMEYSHLQPTTYTQPGNDCPTERMNICITDNDPRCLHHLASCVKNRYINSLSHKESCYGISESRCSISVRNLDWMSFQSKTNVNKDGCAGEKSRFDDLEEMSMNSSFDVLIGSALCYSPYHACLANVIEYFLQGRCNEVIIIQIADRAGFDEFLCRLDSLGIKFSVDTVSEELYNTAQMIGLEKTFVHLQENDINRDNHTKDSTVFGVTNNHEGDVITQKSFIFGSKIVLPAIEMCNKSNDTYLQDIRSISSHSATNLIKTDREAFVILRISKEG